MNPHPYPNQGQPIPRPQPGAGYYQPHHDTFVIQQPAPRPAKDTSVTGLTVPLLLVGSLAVFLVVATYMATSQFADIKHSIEKLANKIDSVTGELTTRVGRIEAENANNVTKRDHDLWCAKTERLNAALGWKCLDDGKAITPQVNGWQARTR